MRLPTQLLRRKIDSHKGDYGSVLILAGSSRFSGADLLSAESTLRAGAGLVTVGIPASINLALIKNKTKELSETIQKIGAELYKEQPKTGEEPKEGDDDPKGTPAEEGNYTEKK